MQYSFKEYHNNRQVFKAKTTQIVKELKKENFTESNAWQQKFNIKDRLLCVERSNMAMDMVEIEILKIYNEIMNYNPDGVYNVDETGLFYKMVPNRTLFIGYGHGQKQHKVESPFFWIPI